MTARRFTEKPDLDPSSVRALPDDHAAMTGNRTLFPSMVVEVTASEPDRILVSGRNNRKLGETVAKGRFAGYAIYGLSLEERATCPTDCGVRSFCYGNGMQMARRHRIGDPDVFYDRLGIEICWLLDEHPGGLLFRLHVLGDFPDVEYVAFWADVLAEHEKVAIYGYTRRRTTERGGDDIGNAIAALKDTYPDRFRIRWSSNDQVSDAARVIDYVPAKPRTEDGIVCPAQTDATACCATCALCWDARHENIVFIKHGPRSLDAAALKASAKAEAEKRDIRALDAQPQASAPAAAANEERSTRPVAAIDLPSSIRPRTDTGRVPEARQVRPADLRVEAAYQRDLSGASIKLIRKIVAGWDWAKFKPPVCAETPEGLFVIDGQHSAIAAASHPEIETIPILVVTAEETAERADAFVAHNRDRLTMSALQVFIAEVAAGSEEAKGVLDAVTRGGGKIPRATPVKGQAKAGEVIAISAIRRMYGAHGAARVTRLVSIAVASGVKPISSTVVYGLQALLVDPRFADTAALPDERIAGALGSITNIEAAAQRHGSQTGQNRYRACAMLVAEKAKAQPLGAAA